MVNSIYVDEEVSLSLNIGLWKNKLLWSTTQTYHNRWLENRRKKNLSNLCRKAYLEIDQALKICIEKISKKKKKNCWSCTFHQGNNSRKYTFKFDLNIKELYKLLPNMYRLSEMRKTSIGARLKKLQHKATLWYDIQNFQNHF